MSALAEVAAAGGRVWVEGKKLRYRLPKDRTDLLEILKAEKAEILAELSARDKALLELCRTACRGLSLWPQEPGRIRPDRGTQRRSCRASSAASLC